MKVFLVAFFVLATCSSIRSAKLQEKFKWKELEFAWPSEEAKESFLQSKRYIPDNNLPLALEVWKNKLFITVPR